MQKKRCQTLQPPTAIKRKKKENAKPVSESNKQQIEETDIEALKSNNALNKNDLQVKKQTFSQKATKPMTKNRKKVLGEIPSFNLDLKDEPSSQPDDLPATNHIDSSVNWTQLQVYKMLKPDDRRRITQFWSIDSR